jgi:hypothetical protein
MEAEYVWILAMALASVRSVSFRGVFVMFRRRNNSACRRVLFPAVSICWFGSFYLLTQWSRDLLEKLTISQLVKKFLAFYGTRRFITASTDSFHLSLF